MMPALGQNLVLECWHLAPSYQGFPWWWKRLTSLPCSIDTMCWLLSGLSSGIFQKLSSFQKNTWHLNQKFRKIFAYLYEYLKEKKKCRIWRHSKLFSWDTSKLQDMLEIKISLQRSNGTEEWWFFMYSNLCSSQLARLVQSCGSYNTVI